MAKREKNLTTEIKQDQTLKKQMILRNNINDIYYSRPCHPKHKNFSKNPLKKFSLLSFPVLREVAIFQETLQFSNR